MNLRKQQKERRKTIDKLEQEMFKLPQVMLDVEEIFIDGIYVRTIFIPKDTLLTSEIHKCKHPFVITEGEINVKNVDTDEVITYTAPYMGITEPMTRRVLYALEDTVWTTYHPNPNNKTILELAKDILVDRKHIIPQYKIQNNNVKEIQI